MRRIASTFLLSVLLTACTPSGPTASPFQGTDITGVNWGQEFSLTDHHGQRRSLADFRGKVVVVFFGYTHCPDVCPTTLAELALTLKQLGKSADKVQVLFVTLDPARDTAAVLAKYVPSFDPGFLGLTGSEAEIAKTAQTFKVFYQKQPNASGKGYTLDHSANTFVFDSQGRLRLMYGFGAGQDKIGPDIKTLLTEK